MTTQKWRIVPVEPTPEMLRAGATRYTAYRVDAGSAMFYAYAAMLEAAPQPPELSDERILEVVAKAEAQWNAQADQRNQWSDLGVDEVVTLVARAIEREILGAPSVPDMPLSMEQFGGLVGLDRDDANEEAIAYKATKLKAVTEQRDKLLEALGLAADMLDMIGQHPQTVANIRRIIAAT